VCKRIAKIQCGAGSLPRDCTITDVSNGGVKVVAEYLEIPPNFTIISRPITLANAGWHGGSATNSAPNSSIRATAASPTRHFRSSPNETHASRAPQPDATRHAA